MLLFYVLAIDYPAEKGRERTDELDEQPNTKWSAAVLALRIAAPWPAVPFSSSRP
jgi:hypothetical protein